MIRLTRMKQYRDAGGKVEKVSPNDILVNPNHITLIEYDDVYPWASLVTITGRLAPEIVLESPEEVALLIGGGKLPPKQAEEVLNRVQNLNDAIAMPVTPPTPPNPPTPPTPPNPPSGGAP